MAMSDVPPPISAIMQPVVPSTGIPAPIAAAIGSSRIKTSVAPLCLTVTPLGTPTTTRKLRIFFTASAVSRNAFSISAVLSKSEITPSCSGLTTEILAGALPSIALASAPTASVLPLSLTAMTEGSLSTMPLPLTKINVLAVPRSIPISFALNKLHILIPPTFYLNEIFLLCYTRCMHPIPCILMYLPSPMIR